MSDLLPMLTSAPDEFEALLLRSADDDEPEAGALGRVGAALGLSASALALSATTGVLTGHVAAASHATALAKQLGVLSLAKWLTVGVAVGLVTGGAAHWVSRPAPAALVAPVTLAPAPAPVRAAPRPVEPAHAESSLPSASEPERALAEVAPTAAAGSTAGGLNAQPTPSAPLTTPALGPSSASFAPLEDARTAPARPPGPAAIPASTLGDETRALDAVRADLGAGRSKQALAGLERYRATWPHGALAAEATLLRVDAWLRSGNRAAAQREADTLISAAPQSRYATRARALMQK